MLERAIPNMRDRDECGTSHLETNLSFPTSMTLLTKSVFRIFFFESLNHDAERSYDLNELISLSLKTMNLGEILRVSLSGSLHFGTKPVIDGFCRYSIPRSYFKGRLIFLLDLTEDLCFDSRINLMKFSWHTTKGVM